MPGKSVSKPKMTVPVMEGDAAIRCNWVTLAKAKSYQTGSPPKFGITLMYAKNNPVHIKSLKKLKADLDACLIEQWPDPATRSRIPVVANQPGTGPKSPIKDGDVAVNDKHIPIKEANPEYAEHFIVTASCNENQRPQVVGTRLNEKGKLETVDPNLCRDGYWYKVNLNAYAYSVKQSGGVTVGLNHVQLIREDECLGGEGPAVDECFGAVAGTDPALYTGDGGGGSELDAAKSQADGWLDENQQNAQTPIGGPAGQSGGSILDDDNIPF
jgi:hypothetical protein